MEAPAPNLALYGRLISVDQTMVQSFEELLPLLLPREEEIKEASRELLRNVSANPERYPLLARFLLRGEQGKIPVAQLREE